MCIAKITLEELCFLQPYPYVVTFFFEDSDLLLGCYSRTSNTLPCETTYTVAQ